MREPISGPRDDESQQILTDDVIPEQSEGGLKYNKNEWVCLDNIPLPNGKTPMSLEQAKAENHRLVIDNILAEIGYYQIQGSLIFYRNGDGEFFVGPQCKRAQKLLEDAGYRNARNTLDGSTTKKGEKAVQFDYVFNPGEIKKIDPAIRDKIAEFVGIHREEIKKEQQDAIAADVRRRVIEKGLMLKF